MTVESDPGFWKLAANWLWALLVPLIYVIWTNLNGRIANAEKKAEEALPKSEFEKHETKVRDDVKELFGRTDALKDHVNARMETLRTDMHEQIGRLRDLIEEKFSGLSREINEAMRRRKGDRDA